MTPWQLVVPLTFALLAAEAPDGSRPAQAASIHWNSTSPTAPVEVIGIDPQNLAILARSSWNAARWSSLFVVWVDPGTDEAANEPTPILGSYRVTPEALQFVPRFPIEPGLRHWARFRPSQLPRPRTEGPSSREIVSEFTRPRPPRPSPTFVARVDPATDRLPENLLKFYIHFSAPMSRGEAYDRVRLLDADGRALDSPFLALGEELWDPTGTRLTLLLDPGRIKRGLRPREEEGPIFRAGRTYTLVVDRAWPDAEGDPLREPFRKSFRTGPADESQPDPKTWKISAPASGTRAPLVLSLPEPLDRAMLDRVLTLHDAEGRPVTGRTEIDLPATRWQFLPERPWRAGTYQLTVDTALEDLAGNSIARPFEVDLQKPITDRLDLKTICLPVTVR